MFHTPFIIFLANISNLQHFGIEVNVSNQSKMHGIALEVVYNLKVSGVLGNDMVFPWKINDLILMERSLHPCGLICFPPNF
jgi:hypothetical protein